MNEVLNAYADEIRADSYATLEYPGTYYLAYRDLPEIIKKWSEQGGMALDFGCGTGRSTRFLKNLGYNAIGLDISDTMICKARELDPDGEYWLMEDGGEMPFEEKTFDLILSVFTFDNIGSIDRRIQLLNQIQSLLKPNGKLIMLDSNPEVYWYEWASFSNLPFPENKYAQSGDTVKIIMKDVEDKRPVEDIVWFNEDYIYAFKKSKLILKDEFHPLGKPEDGIDYIEEAKIAPWVIFILETEVSKPSLM